MDNFTNALERMFEGLKGLPNNIVDKGQAFLELDVVRDGVVAEFLILTFLVLIVVLPLWGLKVAGKQLREDYNITKDKI